MRLHRLFLFVFSLFFTAVAVAKPVATMLQFSYDFGDRFVSRISLRLASYDVDDGPAPGLVLPLYSHHVSVFDRYRMHSSDASRPFCERNPSGCLAFGLLLGVAIAYFVVQVADEADQDTRIRITSGSTGVTVNDAR